jgi:hypothetical protein
MSGFSTINLVDAPATTIAASAEVATLPASNITHPVVQKPWRALITTPTLDIDFGADVDIDALGMFGLTMIAGDTVQHKFSSVSQGAGEVLDTGSINCGVVDGFFQHVYLPNATLTARYWTIVFNATSRVAAGYMDVGRVWAGELWEPDINFSYGWGWGWVDTRDVPRAKRSGVEFPSEGATYRKISVTYEQLSESESDEAEETDRLCGRHKQLLFIPDPAGDLFRGPILGRLADTSITRQPNSSGVFTKSFDVQQSL